MLVVISDCGNNSTTKRLKLIQQILQRSKNGFSCEWFANKIVDTLLVRSFSINARVIGGDHYDLDKRIYFSNFFNKTYPESVGQMIVKKDN